MSPFWLLAGGAIAATVLLGWLFLPDQGRSATGAKAPAETAVRAYVVQWNGPITPSAAGVIVGQADGLFPREGLAIRLQGGKSDADVVAAVTADDRVIGLMTASGFLRARASGSPIVALAASYMTSSVELYALSTTTLNTAADLAGKSISYDPNSDSGSVVEALIRKQQVPRSQIKLAAQSAPVSELLAGRIDVLVGRSEHEGEELRAARVPFRILHPAAFGVHSIGTVYIVSEQALARAPDIAERFLTALIAGWDAAYADYGRTVPIIAAAVDHGFVMTGIAEFMDRQRSYIRPFGARMGELDLARWRELQDRLLAQRLISQPIDVRQAVMFALVPELYRTRLRALGANR